MSQQNFKAKNETKVLFLSQDAPHAVQTEGKGPAQGRAAAEEIPSLTQEGTRGMGRTSGVPWGYPRPRTLGVLQPLWQQSQLPSAPTVVWPSAGGAPGMSCVAGEVCCVPPTEIQGKLCPRAQQSGCLPPQQPAVKSCSSPGTHPPTAAPWAQTPPAHPGKALKWHLKHAARDVSPPLAHTARRPCVPVGGSSAASREGQDV